MTHFWFDYSEKWNEKQTQKQDGKRLENISFSKMVDISVFDVFPFFIHFLCSSCQRALSILFIVTPYGNHLMLITVHTTEWEKKHFWWNEDQLVKTQKRFETDRQCWGNDKIKWGLQWDAEFKAASVLKKHTVSFFAHFSSYFWNFKRLVSQKPFFSSFLWSMSTSTKAIKK